MQKISALIIWIVGGLLYSNAQPIDSIAFSGRTDTLNFEVINPNALRNKSLNEMLLSTPGIFIKSNSNGGVQTVSAQGLSAQHVQVLWNNIPVSSGMLGVADLSLFSVGYKQSLTYEMQAQELATGGIAGVVNISDQFTQQKGYTLGLKQSVGSYGQTLTELLHQGSANRHNWSVTGGYESAQNNFSYTDYTVYPNVKKQQHHGAYNKWHIYPKWRVKLKNGSMLSLYQEIVSNHRSIPPFLVTPNNLAEQNDFVARQMVKWDFHTQNTTHSIYGLFSYSKLYYEDFILKTKQDNKEYLSYFRYRGSWNLKPKWTLNYGSDIKSTEVKSPNYPALIQEWGVDVQSNIVYRPSLFFNIKGLFKVTKRSHLPWYTPFTVEANTFLGKKRHWKFWAYSGMDTRYPTLNDRYWKPGGSESLQPEISYNSSIGISTQIEFKKNTVWRHQVETFFNRVKDMIVWLPTNRGYFQPINQGKVLAYGVHITQSIDWQKGFHDITLQLSYEFNRSGNTQKKSIADKTQWVQLPYYPIHSGKISGQYAWKNLGFRIDGQIYSKRMVTLDGGNFLDPYALLNTSISYTQKLKQVGLEGIFTCNNILNQVYEEVRYRPMPGRNFLFTLLISWKYEKN